MRKFVLMLLLIFSTAAQATSVNYGDLTVTGSMSITTVATDSAQNDVLFQAVSGEIKKFTLPSYAVLDSSPTFTGTVSAASFSGDGSGLTGISQDLSGYAQLNSSPTFTGTVSALAFSGNGSGLTGLVTDYSALTGLPDLTIYSLTDGSRNFTGDVTVEQGLTVTSTLTLSNAPLVAAQSNYLALVGGEVKQAPITPSTTGTLSSTSLTVVGGVGATNSDATVNVATANYTTAGITTAAKYGDFDTNNTDKYGFRNAEDNSLTPMDVTGLSTASLTINATTPLFGTYDYKLTNVTGSASESACTDSVTIPLGSAGRSHGVIFNYSYDGADNDILVNFQDTTATPSLINSVYLTAGTNQKAQAIGFTNSTTTSVRACFIINAVNDGKLLYLDNLKFEVDPQKTVVYTDEQLYTLQQSGSAMTARNGTVEFATTTATVQNTGSSIITTDGSVAGETRFGALRANKVNYTIRGGLATAAYNITVKKYNAAGTLLMTYVGEEINTNGYYASNSGEISLAIGDYFIIDVGGDSFKNTAELVTVTFHAFAQAEGVVHSDNVKNQIMEITQAQSSMTNRAAELEWALATATILNKVGTTDVTYGATTGQSFYAVDDSGSTRTKFVALEAGVMNVSSGVAINDVGSAISIYKNGSIVRRGSAVTTSSYRAFVSYPVYVAVGDYISIGVSTDIVNGADIGYLSISFTPNIVPTTFITPVSQTCYVKQVAAYNVDGGTAGGDTVATRILNVINETGSDVTGTCSFATLATNIFTLGTGMYKIKFRTPAMYVDSFFSILYNVTTSSVVSTGESASSAAGATNAFYSAGEATVTITSPTQFDLRMYSKTGKADNGLGLKHNKSGYNNIYSSVEIEKLR